jgi:hypothetical protein
MLKRCYNKFSNSSDSNRLYINNIIKRINIFKFDEVKKRRIIKCSATWNEQGLKIVKSPFIIFKNNNLIKIVIYIYEFYRSYMYSDLKRVNKNVLHPGHNRIINS